MMFWCATIAVGVLSVYKVTTYLTCDKPRFAASKLNRGSPNAETLQGNTLEVVAEYIGDDC
jgi:hypothetical protein